MPGTVAPKASRRPRRYSPAPPLTSKSRWSGARSSGSRASISSQDGQVAVEEAVVAERLLFRLEAGLGKHGAHEAGVREADFDVAQAEALQHGFAEEDELDVAGRARVADELDAALPVLARLVAGGEAEDVLDVEEARGPPRRQVLDVEAGGGNGGVGSEDDALAAPAVPVEEGVDASEHLRREGAGGGEEVQELDGRRADFGVAPGGADAGEVLFDAAVEGHLVGQQVAHAGAAKGFGFFGHSTPGQSTIGFCGIQQRAASACLRRSYWQPGAR